MRYCTFDYVWGAQTLIVKRSALQRVVTRSPRNYLHLAQYLILAATVLPKYGNDAQSSQSRGIHTDSHRLHPDLEATACIRVSQLVSLPHIRNIE
jgi:hypothetical protein